MAVVTISDLFPDAEIVFPGGRSWFFCGTHLSIEVVDGRRHTLYAFDVGNEPVRTDSGTAVRLLVLKQDAVEAVLKLAEQVRSEPEPSEEPEPVPGDEWMAGVTKYPTITAQHSDKLKPPVTKYPAGPARCTTDGKPFDPTLRPDGQQQNYVVLCEDERAKGFVRPYRDRYVHTGKKLRGTLEMLEKPEFCEQNGKTYVAIDRFELKTEGKPPVRAGTYLTQQEVDQIDRTGFYGGCGTVTTMGRSLSETYARDPKFYGATFCAGCGTHFPVGEFVWDGTDERVGS